MESLLEIGVDHCRRRCEHATVYSHDELRGWLEAALPPQWTVHQPAVNAPGALSACWPADDGADRKAVEDWLRAQGCEDPEDLINGHCEAMAL